MMARPVVVSVPVISVLPLMLRPPGALIVTGCPEGPVRVRPAAVSETTLPLASGAVIAVVHMFGGTASLLSLPGFLLAGAAGPSIVTPVVSMITRGVTAVLTLFSSKQGGSQP